MDDSKKNDWFALPEPALTRRVVKLTNEQREAARRERDQRRQQAKFSNEHHYYDTHVQPATKRETDWRHSHWAAKRAKVRAAMIRTNVREMKLDGFDQCGSGAVIQYSESAQKWRISANYCHCRHCEPCMRKKANLIAANLQESIKNAPRDRHRFITLTLAHSTAGLAEQIKRLYRSFAKMRRGDLWKNSQAGGVAMLEVKWSESGWHPHLHIISAGQYLNKVELSREWHKVTGDSFIVDIRILENSKDAVHYVTKYITKGTSTEVWSNESAAEEWLISSKGVRTCLTFGSWRGIRLTKNTQVILDWKTVITLEKFLESLTPRNTQGLALFQILRPIETGRNPHPGT